MTRECLKLDRLVETLSFRQMYIPPGTVCEQLPDCAIANARSQIREFLQFPTIMFRTYASTKGGARVHKLFRSKDDVPYVVFENVNRDFRVYYLTRSFLRNIFDEDNMPEFEDPKCVVDFENGIEPDRAVVQCLTAEQQEIESIKYQTLTNTLTKDQMYIRPGIICAELSEHYFDKSRQIIREFLTNTDLKVVEYGQSYGGARSHKLFRAEDGVVYQVYESVGREPRIYFLTQYIMQYLFEDYEIVELDIPAEIQVC